MQSKPNGRKREPSRLAMQLAEAFAPCAQWSEVRVQRAQGRRTRVIVADGGGVPGAGPAPFDWAAGAL